MRCEVGGAHRRSLACEEAQGSGERIFDKGSADRERPGEDQHNRSGSAAALFRSIKVGKA